MQRLPTHFAPALVCGGARSWLCGKFPWRGHSRASYRCLICALCCNAHLWSVRRQGVAQFSRVLVALGGSALASFTYAPSTSFQAVPIAFHRNKQCLRILVVPIMGGQHPGRQGRCVAYFIATVGAGEGPYNKSFYARTYSSSFYYLCLCLVKF